MERYIDDVFSIWDTKREDLDIFIAQANKYHPTIKLRRSETPKSLFLTQWFTKEQVSIQNRSLTSKPTINQTETFQYIHYTSCQPPDVKRGFIKGEAIRLLRTNSSETHFQEAISNFKTRLKARGYPKNLIDGTLSKVKFSEGNRN